MSQCNQCGSTGEDVERRHDPYLDEVYGERDDSTLRWYCDDCYGDRRDEV